MPTRLRSFITLALRGLLVLALLASAGCVGGAWKRAVEEDTPSAYYRFLRDHGDSKYAEGARERLEFHKVKRHPTLEGYERFRRDYPDSELTAALHPSLEAPAFEQARAHGTAQAYREFLADFASGALAARAEGNALYAERGGFGGDSRALAEFAKAHPESDFAAEAERTAKAVAARKAGRIERVGLLLDVDPSTPELRRVRQALLERIEKLAERAGMHVVVIPSGTIDPARAARLPRARLEVSHRERQVETQLKQGDLARPARLAKTQVVLREREGGEVIASRNFELRLDDAAWVPNTSVLFSAVAPKYWDEFFVPSARWRNDHAVRPPIALDAPVVDVDGVGDRAVVLYEDGDFDVLGLADPTQPVQLASYRRNEEYKKWSGVRVLKGRVAIYGEEGLELVRFTAAGPVAEKTWTRGEIGRVLSIAPLGDRIVLTGAQGMQLLDPATGEIERVMRRVALSVDTVGSVLVFADGESIYVSDLALLRENRVIAQMKLGRTFGPENVRVLERAAIVTGPGGALVVDVRNPRAPKAIAKLSSREIGEVYDATRVRGRSFLVGQRGLQILDRSLTGIEETIDVGERNRVSVMGRHLVAVDDSTLQVVDATPWAAFAAPATSAPTGGGADTDPLLKGTGF
jgi:hypothetical protein